MPRAKQPESKPPGRISAGVVLWRRHQGRIEVLLGHPGGPYFEKKHAGSWTIPKGEVEPGEALVSVARREFEEETGHEVPASPMIELGQIRQKGGKVVVAWGVQGDLDPGAAISNTFELEWPPGSGRTQSYPELDRVRWFDLSAAHESIREAQRPLLDRLVEALGDIPAP